MYQPLLCQRGKPLIRCTLSGQRRDPRLKAGRWSAVSKSGIRFCVRLRSKSLNGRMIFRQIASAFGGSCLEGSPAGEGAIGPT
jgi:hypothetical protein